MTRSSETQSFSGFNVLESGFRPDILRLNNVLQQVFESGQGVDLPSYLLPRANSAFYRHGGTVGQ